MYKGKICEEFRMTNLIISDIEIFKWHIKTIASLINEARIKISKEGVSIVNIDPANIAMVVYNLKKEWFGNDSILEDAQFGINLQSLKHCLLNISNNTDYIILIPEKDNLIIQEIQTYRMEEPHTKILKEYSIPIIELDEKEQKVPQLSQKVSVSINTTEFLNAIKSADEIGESVAFDFNENQLMMESVGDLSKVKIFPSFEQANIKESPQRSKYSLEYLKMFLSQINEKKVLVDKITSKFSQDYPMELKFENPFGWELLFILAPRVEND